MNKCPKCGSIINQGDSFCSMCGINVSNYNNLQNQYQNNYNDDDLINAYIGNNYNEIKKNDLSFYTFFFGLAYIFYRKMWLLGILVLTYTIIVSSFLPSLSKILIFIMQVVISIKFKELYLKHVVDNVNKIKSENSTKSRNEILMICKKKGGTSPIAAIIVIILVVISIFLSNDLASDKSNKNFIDNTIRWNI